MKARVKATGEIIELSDLEYDVYGNDYLRTDLEIKDEPDYWEKLKHQYAGMAMCSLMPRFERMRQDWINAEFEDGHRITKEEANIALKDYAEAAADVAKVYATALVNKLKEDSQCEK